MSNFNRWWSRRHFDTSEHKEFAREVWTEAAKPYQESIASLSATIEGMAKGQKDAMKAFNEQTKEVKQLREALESMLEIDHDEGEYVLDEYDLRDVASKALQRAGGEE